MKHLNRFAPVLVGLSLVAFGPLGCSDESDSGAGGGGGQATTSSTANSGGSGGTDGSGGAGGVGGASTSSSGEGGAGGGAGGSGGSGGGGGAGGSETPSDCTEVVVTNFGYDSFAGTMNFFLGNIDPDDETNSHLFKLGIDSTTEVKTYDLSAAPNNNASTCEQCVSIETTPDGPQFFVSAGSLKVDLFDDPNGYITATLSDATIVEVTIDGAGASTPVSGGACYHITSTTLTQGPS